MKKICMIIGAVLLLTTVMTACSEKKSANTGASGYTDAAVILTEVKTAQYFTDEEVMNEDIMKILSAGINAPSAMNTQPWHFTAITNAEVTQKIADAMKTMKPPAMKDKPPVPDAAQKPLPDNAENAQKPPEGKPDFSKAPDKAGIGDAPLTIVISCEEGSELSAGLAVQNMSAEAQLLGYGTKILTSPTMALNGENQDEYRQLLNIPDNQKFAAVLIVGKTAKEKDSADALSSATTRNNFDDVATIIGK